MGTFKRTPFEIDTSIKNGSRFLNQTQFTGIVQNNNSFDVDQNAFTDALNVYVNDQNMLVSREPLVEDVLDIELDGELIDIKETNGVKVYVTETENNYKIRAKRDNEIAELTATEYHLAIFNQYIICFRTNGARVINTNNATLVWSDFSTVTADIVSKVTIGPDVEEHDRNQFTDGYIERYIRTHDIQTVLPVDTSAITTYTVKTAALTVKDIVIAEPWRYSKERLFKPVYSIAKDLVDNRSILAADNIVIIPMDEHFLLSYDYGTTFVQVTYPFIEAGIAVPSLSEDGKCFFYISDRLYRFSIDTQQWISYSIYNADGSELELNSVKFAKFINSENFMFGNATRLYIKSLNISYDGYNYNELIAIPWEGGPNLTSLYMKVEGTKTTCGIIAWSDLGGKEYDDYYLYQIFGDTSTALIINKQLLSLIGLNTSQNQIDIDNIMGEKISGTKNWLATNELKNESGSNISCSQYIWTDGFDYYYDDGTDHYKWDKATKVWKQNTWYNTSGNVIGSFYGDRVWKCEGNIYYDDDYVLNKNTMRWASENASNGYAPSWIKQFGDDNYGYYSNGYTHKIRRSESWKTINWTLNNETVAMESRDFWTDGKNLYYSNAVHYKLIYNEYNVNEGTVEIANWTGLGNFQGRDVYHINGETYCGTYKLNTSTNTWEASNIGSANGRYVREVDNNYYYGISSSDMYKLDYLYNSTVTLRYVSDRSSTFTYRKNILTIEKSHIGSTVDEQIFISDTNFRTQITKLNDGNYIYQPTIAQESLGEVYSSYKLYSIPHLDTNKLQSVVNYIPVSEGLYIVTSDGENYNILSNILVEGERFEVDYKYGSTGGYYNEVPTVSYSGSELYLAFNNELQITKNDKDGSNILFNLPTINNQAFAGNIKSIINISTTELAVFFENGITICSKVADDLLGYRYDYAKTRLTLGTKFGDSVINTADGASTLYATPRGLAIMNYQAYMATTDQTLQFISDKIYDIWNKFYLSSENITLVQHGDYVFVYNTTNKYLMLDLRNASWWKFEIPYNIKKILTDQIDLHVIADKLYKFKKIDNGTDKIEDDYIDNRYRDPCDETINWRFMSQRLHFGLPNHYKNMKQIVFHMVQSTGHLSTFATQIKLYRNSVNYKDMEVIPFDFNFYVDEFRTFVKRFNYWKINMLQYGIANDNKTAIPARLVLNGIGVKYEIGDEVR